MSKAVKPNEVPPLPERAARWRRSIRKGSMFHAIDALGHSVCGSIYLDRHKSTGPDGLGDMQYWGVCPRCYSKGKKA